MNKKFVQALFASTCFVAVSSAAFAAAPAVPVVANGIGGVVTGPKGPEAGVKVGKTVRRARRW